MDAAEDGQAALPKRVLQPNLESPKLHKVLAQAGLGSRLEVERAWIREGRITVNNELAGGLGYSSWVIKVDGKPVKVAIDRLLCVSGLPQAVR